jgi:hypothetical protein
MYRRTFIMFLGASAGCPLAALWGILHRRHALARMARLGLVSDRPLSGQFASSRIAVI